MMLYGFVIKVSGEVMVIEYLVYDLTSTINQRGVTANIIWEVTYDGTDVIVRIYQWVFTWYRETEHYSAVVT